MLDFHSNSFAAAVHGAVHPYSSCYCICRLELLEAAGCSVLACTVAWDADCGRARAGGCSTFAEAAADALRALAAVREPGGKAGPAAKVSGTQSHFDRVLTSISASSLMPSCCCYSPCSVPCRKKTAVYIGHGHEGHLSRMHLCFVPIVEVVQVVREGLRHQPDEAGWEALMRPVHDALVVAEGTAAAPLRHVEPDTARREFAENGQTGLDELLAALDGNVEVRQMTGLEHCLGRCCMELHELLSQCQRSCVGAVLSLTWSTQTVPMRCII